MQIRYLTPDYAVSEQITPEDIPALKQAGFTTVICNRPDHEIPPMLQAKTIAAAAEAAGLSFVLNPVEGGTLGLEEMPAQGAALAAASGPVFAYCRSGTRSSVVWALAQAQSGAMAPGDIIAAAGKAGYDLAGLTQTLAQLAGD